MDEDQLGRLTDQRTHFQARAFQRALRALGVRQRFGAIGKTGSIAIIERTWRSLTAALGVRIWRPLTREDLEQRLALALVHYTVFRLHQALGGATPLEVYAGLKPTHVDGAHPPRGRPGEAAREPPFVVDHLDDERHLQVLLRAAWCARAPSTASPDRRSRRRGLVRAGARRAADGPVSVGRMAATSPFQDNPFLPPRAPLRARQLPLARYRTPRVPTPERVLLEAFHPVVRQSADVSDRSPT